MPPKPADLSILEPEVGCYLADLGLAKPGAQGGPREDVGRVAGGEAVLLLSFYKRACIVAFFA